ncbi:MAG TPA: hypothetical protein VM840_08640 [Actinomycetota bacterium]|nr:hypothetical protein [Actinomycetota bacterium]
MATCDSCGNDYHRSFEVRIDGETHTFDSFECAIHKLAPTCETCGVRIVGHGMEDGERVFCCAHCAHASGVTSVSDSA